ncbi:Cytokinin riboside 5'-monophosphate phosphoribohydrolase [Alphaproteobacteria bacterium]
MRVICVFCGASDDVVLQYKRLASECGEAIGKNGYGLLYGGGASGLMGAVAKSATMHGAPVTGVFPTADLNPHDVMNQELGEAILVKSLSERKDIMIKRADAFVILPGGFGTLDEFFEIVTLKKLGVHNKPIILVNYGEFWAPLLTLMEHICDTHFAKLNLNSSICAVVKSVEEAFFLLRNSTAV